MRRQGSIHIGRGQKRKAMRVDNPVYIFRIIVDVMDGWVGHMKSPGKTGAFLTLRRQNLVTQNLAQEQLRPVGLGVVKELFWFADI